MSIEIRPVPAADTRSWLNAVEVAGSGELSDEMWNDMEATIERDRVLGAYDGDQIVGGGATFSLGLTVPGPTNVRAAGITGVGVIPSHRRQGILRRLMARQLADAKAAGEPVAILWASEGQIYQRFGYGLATLTASIDLERDRAQLRTDESRRGTVRLIDVDEAARLFPPIYEANLRSTPGFCSRSETWWKIEVLADFKWARRGADRKFYALHERDGRPHAYAMYRAKHDWPEGAPGSELQVQEVMALDGEAYLEMWRFLLGVDLIKRVKTRFSNPGDPLLQMLAEPRRLLLKLRDGLWLRIVDIPGALRARGYAADDSLVLEVSDEFMPDTAGRFRISTADGRAEVTPTTDKPDFALDIADLGAIYLGAFTLADLARAGRTSELAAGARARADAMFASPTPAWCPEIF